MANSGNNERLNTFKNIDKELSTFKLNRDALKSLAHTIAMMIIRNCAPKSVSADCEGSGNCSRALVLVNELPKSWRPMMCQFFAAYTPIRVIPVNDKCGLLDSYKKLATQEEKDAAWKISEAEENPFFTIPEPDVADPTQVDFKKLVKMVEGVASRITSLLEENRVRDEDVASAQNIVNIVGNLHFSRVEPPANDTQVTTEQGAPQATEAAAA